MNRTIQANDLRIGNYLIYDETIYSYGLKKEEFIVDAKFIIEFDNAKKEGNSDWYDMISGVPLTSQKLIELGFDKRGDEWCGAIVLEQNNDDELYYSAGEGVRLSEPIDFVHQLQNMVYALEKKEIIYSTQVEAK